MRRAVTILLILATVVGASLYGYRAFAGEKTPPPPDYEAVRVERGTLISTVSATGSILPETQLALSFKATGRVAEVLVSNGQRVQKGDLLARLESAELELQLQAAEAQLAISQARLGQLRKPASAGDLAAAEAQLASAQANYRQLLSGPNPDQVQIARAQLEKARALLQQAQAAYDQVKHLPNIGALPQSLQLQQATLDIQIAEANYRLATAGPTEAQKAAALAQVAQAQAQLDRLKAGASAEEIAIAEAQVRQAEVQVAQARLALENTRLLAPVDGVVVSVNIKAGEFPSAARPAVILNDDSRFHIDVNVDEIDVRSVAVGQPVTVTLDALPDARLTGRVTYVAPAATQEMGVVSYLVTVVLDPTTEPLRAGMSATASITVAEKRDALVVPNRAIQIDRATGKAYVEKVVNGMPTRTEIRLGMRNETQSQVLEGLQEGDVIAIRNASQRERLQQLFFGG